MRHIQTIFICNCERTQLHNKRSTRPASDGLRTDVFDGEYSAILVRVAGSPLPKWGLDRASASFRTNQLHRLPSMKLSIGWSHTELRQQNETRLQAAAARPLHEGGPHAAIAPDRRGILRLIAGGRDNNEAIHEAARRRVPLRSFDNRMWRYRPDGTDRTSRRSRGPGTRWRSWDARADRPDGTCGPRWTGRTGRTGWPRWACGPGRTDRTDRTAG